MDIGDGTSAATPIFSAILSMLNDWLLANNEAPIGFANPLLYDLAANYPQAFYGLPNPLFILFIYILFLFILLFILFVFIYFIYFYFVLFIFYFKFI